MIICKWIFVICVILCLWGYWEIKHAIPYPDDEEIYQRIKTKYEDDEQI